MRTGTEWHPFLVPSTKRTEHKVNADTAKLLVDMAPNDLGRIIGALAAANDVESLRNFMPLASRIAESKGFSSTPTKLGPVKFSVAHMLLEGTGNEDFAREWVAAFGTTKEEIRSQAEQASMHAFSTGTDLVNVQRFIGLCKLDGHIFEDHSITGSDERFPTSFFTTPNDHVRAVLAATLAAVHPDVLPMTLRDGYETPLAHLIISKYPFNLPILAQVYSSDNTRVREQIQDAMKDELESGPRINKGQLWEAIPTWGDSMTVDQVVKAEFSFYDAFNNERKNAPFLDALEARAGMDYDPTYAFSALLRLGMDVNQPFPPTGRRLIDAAVAGNHADSFAMLFAHGANPELRSEPGLREYNALEILAIKRSDDDAHQAQIERMRDVARNWMASKAARSVIAELELETGAKISI